MAEKYRFTSEDTAEEIRLNKNVEGLGLRNIRVENDDYDDTRDSDDYQIEIKRAENNSPAPPSVTTRGHKETEDVDFGLDYLINPKTTYTDEQIQEQTKPVFTTSDTPPVEPLGGFIPGLDRFASTLRKGSDDELKSDRSISSRRSSHRSRDRSSRASSKSGKSGGWRSGDFRTNKEAEYDRKAMILRQLSKLERRGIPMSKKFTMASDLDDMEREYYRLKGEFDGENAVLFMRETYLHVLNTFEMLNEKYDPFDFHLNGFTDHTFQNIQRYDNVFEELYEKYHNRVNMPPEVKLLLMTGSSALVYHMTHKVTENEQMMRKIKNNPEAMRKLREMADGNIGRGGGGGDDDDDQTREFKRRKTEYETAQGPTGAPAAGGNAAPIQTRDGFGREFISPEVNRGGPLPGAQNTRGDSGQRQMRGPKSNNVAEIMERMREREREAEKSGTKNISDTESEEETSRTVSVPAGKSKRGRPAAKAGRSIKI